MKILNYYNKVAEWICSFSADRYVHLISCLLIAEIASGVCHRFGLYMWISAVAGLFTGVSFGFLKEVFDKHRGELFDKSDFIFSYIGAIIGSLLFII